MSSFQLQADYQAGPLSKPIVIGIYGLPGCGKSYLLHQLKEKLVERPFQIFEGSEVITSLHPGGLDAFKKLAEDDKVGWRERAIDTIANKCAGSGRAGIVSGHYMFWEAGENAGRVACTKNDLRTYTHIIYLDVDPEVILSRRLNDAERSRSPVSVDHIRKWQEAEKIELRQLCNDNSILFSMVPSGLDLLDHVLTLVQDSQRHTEDFNLSCAKEKLDAILASSNHPIQSMLVLDADRTLAAEDTGLLFWEFAARRYTNTAHSSMLKDLFSGPLGYSYLAFRQAALLYEAVCNDHDFDLLCEEVATAVTMRPEFASLLKLAGKLPHVGAVVITCGLRCVWNKILEKAGLSEVVQVIGGGRLADGYVISPDVKGSLILHLQTVHGIYVRAFGDSPVDLPMLAQAHDAIVVVGEENTRSKSMDAALLEAIDNGGLQARQVLLPRNVSPRLDTNKLPLVDMSSRGFAESFVFDLPGNCGPGLRILHATDKKAAKLLMTPMRDATIAGPALRDAHYNAGWYLATEFLTELLGVEEHPMKHVQGNMTTGHRLLHEKETLIVPLMRGGEPMAFGVNRAFPLASFVHARYPSDIMALHLEDVHNVILVDSVINSGKSVVDFVGHVQDLSPTIRIVVVAGVVQEQAISKGGLVYEHSRHAVLDLVVLRISENKYSGKGGTDTGNRLFNTTHLA